MPTTFMRTGPQLQYLHRVGCKRYHWWNRALGQVVDWPWPDHHTRAELVHVIQSAEIKVCKSCQPLAQHTLRSV